jgi:hypothetical protein
VAANGAVVAGSLCCEREREKREREKRGGRKTVLWFKPLSHTKRIGVTQLTSTHTSYDIWPVSCGTTVDTTKLRQYAWHDSGQHGATSASGHASAS